MVRQVAQPLLAVRFYETYRELGVTFTLDLITIAKIAQVRRGGCPRYQRISMYAP
jgi:hypothetical protein